jgi:uncharacterized protein (DUF488 family)
MSLQRVVTIGVYGFGADGFFTALLESGVDLFCDLRARRGVRGREYAFANARRLEARLSECGIPYRHFPALAPSDEMRALQYAVDSAAGIGKRDREELSAGFIAAYERLLAGSAAREALAEIRQAASAPALHCVERLPSACHRSLVAARLASGIAVDHVVPRES